MSRLGVNEGLEQDFIKVILTKDQWKSKGNKEWMRIRKSRYVESNWTRCYTEKFNTALSLYRVLRITLYFSKGFSEVAARVSAVAEALQPLDKTMVYFLRQKSSL